MNKLPSDADQFFKEFKVEAKKVGKYSAIMALLLSLLNLTFLGISMDSPQRFTVSAIWSPRFTQTLMPMIP